MQSRAHCGSDAAQHVLLGTDQSVQCRRVALKLPTPVLASYPAFHAGPFTETTACQQGVCRAPSCASQRVPHSPGGIPTSGFMFSSDAVSLGNLTTCQRADSAYHHAGQRVAHSAGGSAHSQELQASPGHHAHPGAQAVVSYLRSSHDESASKAAGVRGLGVSHQTPQIWWLSKPGLASAVHSDCSCCFRLQAGGDQHGNSGSHVVQCLPTCQHLTPSQIP